METHAIATPAHPATLGTAVNAQKTASNPVAQAVLAPPAVQAFPALKAIAVQQAHNTGAAVHAPPAQKKDVIITITKQTAQPVQLSVHGTQKTEATAVKMTNTGTQTQTPARHIENVTHNGHQVIIIYILAVAQRMPVVLFQADNYLG